MNRRRFLSTTLPASTLTLGRAMAAQSVSLILERPDPAVRWASSQLTGALAARGVTARLVDRAGDAAAADLRLTIRNMQGAPESFELGPNSVAGADTRGLVYGLLELADRVQFAADPLAAVSLTKTTTERPANPIRSVARLFCSDVEDKPWYNDREMWPQYLTMLAAQRFNRFHLALGIGYDFIRQVTDGYFLFPYPFFLNVPGYRVRVPQLPDSERDHNLEMLRYISEQTAARGLHFQLGLWMHGYEWIDSPNPNYTIAGITKENHGPYCRDAVRMLLQACPQISGITFRVHGESGVEEGSYDFWRTVFEGVSSCGRKVEIDMHSKGMDQTMLDLAVATGLPVRLSPKYWAEHMGMSYHQADIREQEVPKSGRNVSALMKFSAGSRSFLRYGYGDLLREDRKWSVIHRIWPGTQRLLLWGDPVTAAAHSKAFRFCGSDGVDLCEPLSFKGRRGSGIAGDRCAYADASLKPRWDWQKYLYTYRVWGRLLYSPEADPDSWRRYLRHEFAAAAPAAETALANASRILPTITTAHGVSAANNNYWPEMYLNQPMFDAEHFQPYSDGNLPRVFPNASPFDPQLFSRMNEFADQLLAGERSGKYSPIEVAQWLEDYASEATKALAEFEAKAPSKSRPEVRRWAVDTAIEAGLGRFFAAKFRAGVLYRIYEQTGSRTALEESIKAYKQARQSWAALAERGKVYKSDVTIGEHRQLRGHWLDRLPAIDADIAGLERKLGEAGPAAGDAQIVAAIREAQGRPQRPNANCRHTPPGNFRPGQPLPLEIAVDRKLAAVTLFYRHVTQAERWTPVAMEGERTWRGTIPATYTDSSYALEYYFELKESGTRAWLYPGLGPEKTQQPYVLVRRA